MTESNYDRLWEFTKQHKDYRGENPHEPQAVAIFKLFQQIEPPIVIQSAEDMEEACQCIRMALMYA
jgi:hypothetical protein